MHHHTGPHVVSRPHRSRCPLEYPTPIRRPAYLGLAATNGTWPNGSRLVVAGQYFGDASCPRGREEEKGYCRYRWTGNISQPYHEKPGAGAIYHRA